MAIRPHILIVEDEDAIARGLKFNFELEGYDAIVLGDGPQTLAYFDSPQKPIDLVVLDLMLPGMSGYEILRSIRERDPRVPIMVLSARTLSEDRAHAFDCGTDQYMTKPFALPELLSRVRNLLDRRRRFATGDDESTTLPDECAVGLAKINFRTFEVTHGDEVHTLTTMELQLLRYFLEHEGQVLSRQQILKDVWEQNADVTTRTIDNFVMRLRKYLEADPTVPQHLLSVRGTGYRFVVARTGECSQSGSDVELPDAGE
ncbi:MAG: response regulator transcription factor [Planctomycetaceae bacterium]